MVDIQNQEVLRRISDEAKIMQLETPQKLSPIISPVIISNERPEIKIATGNASDTTAATILTTSSTKRTFIIGAQLSYSKDVNATSTNTSITLFPKGSPVRNLLILRYEPLTAGQGSISLSLSSPLELEKNTIIYLLNSTNVASIDSSTAIYYYELEDLMRR